MLSQSIAIVLFLFFFITLPSTFSIPHSICALSLSFCPSLARLHTRFIYLCKNRPIKKLINVHHIAFIAESVIGLVFQGMEHKIYTQTSTHTHPMWFSSGWRKENQKAFAIAHEMAREFIFNQLILILSQMDILHLSEAHSRNESICNTYWYKRRA